MTSELPTIEKPAPAPKAKKPVDAPLPMPSDAEAGVSELEMEYEHYFSMADEMLRSIATENRLLRFEELTFFRGRCGWDDSEIRRQRNRMASVVRSQSIAGTYGDREAAFEENKKSHEILETEKPKIEKQIAALQDQLSALERNSNRAARRCEEIDSAVSDLKRLLRPDLLAKYNAHLSSIVGEFAKLGELSTQICHLEICLGPVPDDYNDHQRFLEMVRMYYPDCVERSEFYQGRLIFVEPEWTSQKASMEIELVSMRSELELLQHRKAERLESLQPMLNFYLMESK